MATRSALLAKRRARVWSSAQEETPMRRREFITLIGGAAATRPVAARAQQPERMRLVGVLMAYAESDSAIGTKRTLPRCQTMSAFGGKADMSDPYPCDARQVAT